MNYDRLKNILINQEGYREKPYKCSAGKLTIGVGRNLEDRGLSHAEIDMLLSNDIRTCEKELRKEFYWFEKLDDVRQEVLLNMCFNLGISRLKQFKKTLNYIECGMYNDAATEMLDSKWADQVGRRARKLSDAMRTGRF
jgi:lysozyme